MNRPQLQRWVRRRYSESQEDFDARNEHFSFLLSVTILLALGLTALGSYAGWHANGIEGAVVAPIILGVLLLIGLVIALIASVVDW